MWNFQRIICIWICCVSCMFGTTQLSSLVQAVPYEYFDDHEQSFYDLDTEQIQAKYDTRLLSQQMLQTEQQQQRQHQQHLENLKGFHNSDSGGQVEANRNKLENIKHNDAGGPMYISTTTTKLKSNDGYTLNDDNKNCNNERNDWLEETATKAAASSTITETLDELYLPRAASCFTNGQKYTHGQKVPRLDNCEVCLCMDGEIFCWWEKCDKKSTKASTTYDDYSTPFEESSTTRMQLNPKTTYKTTLKPMKKPKTNEDYKYDDDDSAEIFKMQQEYEGLKEELMRKEHEQEQHKIHHNKQMVKKKIYQQQEEEKHNKKIKEQNKKKQEEQQRHKQQQQQKQHKNNEQHHHAHNRNNNNNRNNNHDYSSSGSSSKILNFPENLPSVLYYDYKTEEHHQHQHQHREQHLKHQKQKQQQLLLQQHEKELKHRQQQQQQQQQHHVNRHHEYGQDFNTYNSNADKKPITTTGGGGGERDRVAGTDERKLHDNIGGPSTTFKYFSNGNENIYNGDLQTDSDILPEPPTKKPKFSTSITDTTATAKTTGTPMSEFYRSSTSTTAGGITKSTITATTTTTTKALTNTPPTASILLKKQIFSPWDYNKPNRDKINNNNSDNVNNNIDNNNKESTEDIIDTDDQDDAFHRWLTSTEKNNKNNFTLNDSIMGRDDDGGLDAINMNDYNMEDRNYENIDLETEAGLSTIITKTKATLKPITTMGAGTTTMTVNAFDMTRGEKEREGEGERGEVIFADGDRILFENNQKPKYEQNFNDNNSYSNNNNNNNNMANSNGNNYKNNISPFSHNPYQDYNNENNNVESPTSSSGNVNNSTTSNEDNGVASVVNIDIMLTASSADSQQLQQLSPQQTNIETTNQHRQLQDFEYEKQIAKAQLKFVQPPVLISNTNVVDNKNPLYSIINDNNKSYTSNNNSSNNNNKTVAYIVGDGLNIEEQIQLQNVGVNLSSSNNSNSSNNNNNSAISLSSSGDSLRFNHISTMVSQTNATLATTAAGASAKTPPPLSTTLSPERQCNVMGTLYKIGDVLPQDTGNCLQCICIDGSTSDDTPRVTCSPHNCPPLVLPDLFDATGY